MPIVTGRVKEIARVDRETLQQPVRIPLGRELQTDVDQRSQPRGGSSIAGLSPGWIGDRREVKAIEFRGEGSGSRRAG